MQLGFKLEPLCNAGFPEGSFTHCATRLIPFSPHIRFLKVYSDIPEVMSKKGYTTLCPISFSREKKISGCGGLIPKLLFSKSSKAIGFSVNLSEILNGKRSLGNLDLLFDLALRM